MTVCVLRYPSVRDKHPCTLTLLRGVLEGQWSEIRKKTREAPNLAMAAVGELRPAAVSELVTLYVGGVAFETTRGTLTSVADSALARLYIAAPTSDPP